MEKTIQGAHTCFICKDRFSWEVTLSAAKMNSKEQAKVVVASTFFTVEGRKADLEIYATCPTCQTKYKIESSCPIEMLETLETV